MARCPLPNSATRNDSRRALLPCKGYLASPPHSAIDSARFSPIAEGSHPRAAAAARTRPGLRTAEPGFPSHPPFATRGSRAPQPRRLPLDPAPRTSCGALVPGYQGHCEPAATGRQPYFVVFQVDSIVRAVCTTLGVRRCHQFHSEPYVGMPSPECHPFHQTGSLSPLEPRQADAIRRRHFAGAC